ncbi:hypothetical protein EDD85DRAFT_961980 [Armillaria nabsnona]|nr:hypothetical protein EDD85DRAFT_961980 [Armillaria nabsnona]
MPVLYTVHKSQTMRLRSCFTHRLVLFFIEHVAWMSRTWRVLLLFLLPPCRAAFFFPSLPHLSVLASFQVWKEDLRVLCSPGRLYSPTFKANFLEIEALWRATSHPHLDLDVGVDDRCMFQTAHVSIHPYFGCSLDPRIQVSFDDEISLPQHVPNPIPSKSWTLGRQNSI